MLGWQNLVGGDFELVAYSLGGLVELLAHAPNHVSSSLEDAGHGDLVGVRMLV
jgi:hypothetical protein